MTDFEHVIDISVLCLVFILVTHLHVTPFIIELQSMFTNAEQNRNDKNKALMANSLICDVLNPLGLVCFALSFFC